MTYHEWLDSDLIDATSISELIDLPDTKTLRKLIKLFQSAAFLKNKVLVQWTNDLVEFHLHNKYDLNKPVQPPTRECIYVQNQHQLQKLHENMFSTLHDWSCTSSESFTTQCWKNSLAQGNSIDPTWDEISQPVSIKTYWEYYHIISACTTLIQTHLYFFLINDQYIGYCDYHPLDQGSNNTDDKDSTDTEDYTDNIADKTSNHENSNFLECVSSPIKNTPLTTSAP